MILNSSRVLLVLFVFLVIQPNNLLHILLCHLSKGIVHKEIIAQKLMHVTAERLFVIVVVNHSVLQIESMAFRHIREHKGGMSHHQDVHTSNNLRIDIAPREHLNQTADELSLEIRMIIQFCFIKDETHIMVANPIASVFNALQVV